jgi:hypothetical protein
MNWQLPEVDPNEIAESYLKLVRRAPGHVAVWSRIEGAKLHLYTVLDKKLTAEAAVYSAERSVLERYDPALVQFHVYPDPGPLKAMLKDLTPLLQPFDALRG